MALTDVDKVRILIGLTEQSPFYEILTDEEVEWFLELADGDIIAASIEAGYAVVRFLSQINTKEKFGEVEAWNEVSKQYREAFLIWADDKKTLMLLPKGVMPYAAGVSKADLNASMADCDNPNVTNWLYMNAVEVPCCVVI